MNFNRLTYNKFLVCTLVFSIMSLNGCQKAETYGNEVSDVEILGIDKDGENLFNFEINKGESNNIGICWSFINQVPDVSDFSTSNILNSYYVSVYDSLVNYSLSIENSLDSNIYFRLWSMNESNITYSDTYTFNSDLPFWKNRLSELGLLFYSISVTESGNGAVVGQNGAFYRTNDFGKTWWDNSFNDYYQNTKVVFLDNNYGYILSLYHVGSYQYQPSKIKKTDDGGSSWFDLNLGDIGMIEAFDCYNRNNLSFITYQGLFKRSIDGGDSWTELDLNNFKPYSDHVAELVFVTESIGYFITQYGSLYKTTDAGTTWVVKNPKIGLYYCNPMFFTNTNVGYIGSAHLLYKTTNGGSTWNLIYEGDGTGNINSIDFSDSQNGLFSIGKYIEITTDGGLTWRRKNPGAEYQINHLQMTTTKEIYSTSDRSGLFIYN